MNHDIYICENYFIYFNKISLDDRKRRKKRKTKTGDLRRKESKN